MSQFCARPNHFDTTPTHLDPIDPQQGNERGAPDPQQSAQMPPWIDRGLGLLVRSRRAQLCVRVRLLCPSSGRSSCPALANNLAASPTCTQQGRQQAHKEVGRPCAIDRSRHGSRRKRTQHWLAPRSFLLLVRRRAGRASADHLAWRRGAHTTQPMALYSRRRRS